MSDIFLSQFLGLFSSETVVKIESQEYLDKIHWQGTVGEYFDNEKLSLWHYDVQTVSIDDNEVTVRI